MLHITPGLAQEPTSKLAWITYLLPKGVAHSTKYWSIKKVPLVFLKKRYTNILHEASWIFISRK